MDTGNTRSEWTVWGVSGRPVRSLTFLAALSPVCLVRTGLDGIGDGSMIHDYELGQLVAQAQQNLRRIQQDIVALSAHLATIQRMFLTSPSSCKRTPAVSPSDPRTRTAIVNGRRLADSEIRTLDEDAYDVILDTTNSTLRHREHPGNHTELRLSDTHGVGPYRIKILALMMDRFGVTVCSDNVDHLLGDTNRIVTAHAFTKSISVLRQALGGGGRHNPYIQSVAAWESSRSKNAQGYLLNPKWKYLLVRHEESQKSQ